MSYDKSVVINNCLAQTNRVSFWVFKFCASPSYILLVKCLSKRFNIVKSHLSQILCYDRITINDYIYFLILDNHILVMLILSLWATEQNYFRLKCFFDTPHIMLLSYCCCFYRYFIVQDIKVDKHMLRGWHKLDTWWEISQMT